jgi:AraC-like DNA-binding protein
MTATSEAPLAYLGFQLIKPSPALRPYVQSYWCLRRTTPLATLHEESMHPRGGFGVVFNAAGSLLLDGQAVCDPVFLDGATTISRTVGFYGQVDLFGVRFHEGGAYPLLGIPLAELRNALGLLDALDRPNLLRLAAQIYGTESLPARIRWLEDWLLRRLALGKERNPIIPASLLLLRQSGEVRMPDLAREFAISQRQMERLYQTQVGMSPKQYTQLVRVEQARLALKRGGQRPDGPAGPRTTADLAAELGYYDQSHFIREFRAVVGMTPTAYLKRSRSARSPGR